MLGLLNLNSRQTSLLPSSHYQQTPSNSVNLSNQYPRQTSNAQKMADYIARDYLVTTADLHDDSQAYGQFFACLAGIVYMWGGIFTVALTSGARYHNEDAFRLPRWYSRHRLLR